MSKKNPPAEIDQLIFTVRGHRVILDSDLAKLYGVETRRLNEQVKRNPRRFQEDFAFQLTRKEWDHLRSQNATSRWGGRRYTPYVFTEHGALMAANVLSSPQAVDMSVQVVRTFVQLRQMTLSVEQLARKVAELEEKHDQNYHVLYEAIAELMRQPDPSQKKIGFHSTS